VDITHRPADPASSDVLGALVGEQLDYLWWARDRILVAAADLSRAAFCAQDTVTARSIRATLAHQVECEWAWRIRLSTGSFPDGDVLPGDFETLDELAERWREEERALRGWFDKLSADDLRVRPPDLAIERWQCLLYVVNHGTQQLTEAALLLTVTGRSPGEIGFLEFCSSRDAA
jgi:uncharacterized damage-inducible protein DinB